MLLTQEHRLMSEEILPEEVLSDDITPDELRVTAVPVAPRHLPGSFLRGSARWRVKAIVTSLLAVVLVAGMMIRMWHTAVSPSDSLPIIAGTTPLPLIDAST